jgi:hypothetical protein
MKNKDSILKFGEDVENYNVPVLNEREIRAAAGMMFLVLLIALMFILFKQNFLLVKYVIVVFFIDFIIRIFFSPRFSPVLTIGRLFVSTQVPEYVGAPQKKFAWKIGLALSSLMFFLMVILNTYSIITGVTCLLCFVFLFFESAFGICLGCLMYRLFYKAEALNCAGESCEAKTKHPIQRTSWMQLLVLLGWIAFLLVVATFYNDQFSIAPKNLKEIINSF